MKMLSISCDSNSLVVPRNEASFDRFFQILRVGNEWKFQALFEVHVLFFWGGGGWF